MHTDPSHPDFSIKLGDTLNHLRDLFDAAVDVPVPAREAWLASHVADSEERAALRQLLAADAGSGFLDTPAVELDARIITAEIKPEGLIGREIGQFRLVRTLGQGGMATVFLGERVGRDFAQRAAIKLLRRGLYSELEQRLFLRERQVLAALDHPNIARLIDGGVTEAGIPYLVLEYIDGVPITQYADEHRLDVPQRLALFLSVCRAVEAAHRALIVHRDIKPSNILVTETGEVKLLDFGIAKLIEEDADNATGTIGVFTPDYAAPEQKQGGAITTATDVYGLGVLLHELLLGLKPDGNTTDGSGPRRPSSRANEIAPATKDGPLRALAPERLSRLLRGDLDNILLKALEVEPERRYASAGAFADDIDRHLHGRPVVAHPPTRWYRTQKFIQRHRGGVTITAILVLAIFAALGLALWQTQVARQQAQIARAQTQRTEAVKDLLVGIFNNEIPERPRDKTPDTAQLLEQGVKHARTELTGTPGVQSEMLTALGHVYTQLAQLDKSEPLLDEAVAAARRVDPPDFALLGAALSERAGVDLKRNRYPQAIALYDQAVLLQQQTDPESLALAETLIDRALAFGESGVHDKSIADYRSALAIREKRLPANDLGILDVYEKIGSAYERNGQPSEATEYLHTALEAARAKFGEAHVTTTRYTKNYALNLAARRQYAEAATLTEQAVRIERTLYPKGDPTIGNGLNNLGYLYFNYMGRLHAALEALTEVQALNRDAGLNHSRGQIFVLSNLATVHEILGDTAETLALVDEGEHTATEVVGADHGLTLRLNLRHARLEFDAKPNSTTAAALLNIAQRIAQHPEKLGQYRAADEIDALVAIGRAQAALGHDAEAEAALQSAVGKLPTDHIDPARLPAAIALADWEREHKAAAAAESLLRDFIARATRELPPTHYALGELRLALAELLAVDNRPAEALQSLSGSETAFSELPETHPWRLRAVALHRKLAALAAH